MSKFFECVRCGVVTPVESSPPRCRNCGHGTGILHLKDPRGDSRKGGENGETGRPDGSPVSKAPTADPE